MNFLNYFYELLMEKLIYVFQSGKELEDEKLFSYKKSI